MAQSTLRSARANSSNTRPVGADALVADFDARVPVRGTGVQGQLRVFRGQAIGAATIIKLTCSPHDTFTSVTARACRRLATGCV